MGGHCQRKKLPLIMSGGSSLLMGFGWINKSALPRKLFSVNGDMDRYYITQNRFTPCGFVTVQYMYSLFFSRFFTSQGIRHCLWDSSLLEFSGFVTSRVFITAQGVCHWPGVDRHCVSGQGIRHCRYFRYLFAVFKRSVIIWFSSVKLCIISWTPLN